MEEAVVEPDNYEVSYPFMDSTRQVVIEATGELIAAAKVAKLERLVPGDRIRVRSSLFEVTDEGVRLVSRTPEKPAEQEQVGRKDDKDKPPMHLIPTAPLLWVAKVLGFGRSKYGANNWQKLENASQRYYDAAIRHLFAWQRGERLDSESGLPHLAHAATCIMFMLFTEERDGLM